VRALCSRALLLNAGSVVVDGKPSDVLNRYQRIIMAREEAYEAQCQAAERVDEDGVAPEAAGQLHYTYRHGDGSAEIMSVTMLDSSFRPVEIIETGEAVYVRLRVRFFKDSEEPVFGFLIRNRHGIHVYGTNTRLQEVSLGRVRAGEAVEVLFAFDCWLGVDTFNVTVAVHSADGSVSYDWLDGALFFRVLSTTGVDGVANLHASATARRLGESAAPLEDADAAYR
jgi:hypothetical protein